MPANKERTEGNATRKQRLAKLKKGPGFFRYDGSSHDTHYEPTVLLTGRQDPVFDAAGLPVQDRSGRQVFKAAGQVVTDAEGMPVLGGAPKISKTKIEAYSLWGVSFPEGEAVEVTNASLALKLRGMDGFEEVDGLSQSKKPEDATEAGELSRAELLKLAKERGLEVDKTFTKAALLAALEEAAAGASA